MANPFLQPLIKAAAEHEMLPGRVGCTVNGGTVCVAAGPPTGLTNTSELLPFERAGDASDTQRMTPTARRATAVSRDHRRSYLRVTPHLPSVTRNPKPQERQAMPQSPGIRFAAEPLSFIVR